MRHAQEKKVGVGPELVELLPQDKVRFLQNILGVRSVWNERENV